MLKHITTVGAVLTAQREASLPTPSSAWRGTTVTVSVSGEDVLYICLKGESGSYYWVPFSAGGY